MKRNLETHCPDIRTMLTRIRYRARRTDDPRNFRTDAQCCRSVELSGDTTGYDERGNDPLQAEDIHQDGTRRDDVGASVVRVGFKDSCLRSSEHRRFGSPGSLPEMPMFGNNSPRVSMHADHIGREWRSTDVSTNWRAACGLTG